MFLIKKVPNFCSIRVRYFFMFTRLTEKHYSIKKDAEITSECEDDY